MPFAFAAPPSDSLAHLAILLPRLAILLPRLAILLPRHLLLLPRLRLAILSSSPTVQALTLQMERIDASLVPQLIGGLLKNSEGDGI